MTIYRLNTEKNGVEIVFDSKPAEAIRTELKENGFRWGRGYWYAKQTPERLALAARLAEGTTEAPKTEKVTGTPQNRIKFYYNGLRLDGSKKILPCYYYKDRTTGAVTISARDYKDLPRDIFDVHNDTDIYTDYFDNDSARLEPFHPLYKYALYAYAKSEERTAKHHIEWLKSRPNAERYTDEIERAEKQLAELQTIADPGQPTAEDLAKIDTQRQEEENRRRAEEHARELAERERVLAERHNGYEYINEVAELYPIEEGAPVVNIPFSENPAFYSFMVEDRKTITRHPDGTTTEEITEKMPRCILSVTAAEIVLKHFDEKRHAENIANNCGGYDKTDFIITWTDENGEPWEYSGRYDLGDNDGGMIRHIEALAEWDRTHDKFGRPTDEPQEISESRFAWVELLKRYSVAA